MPSQLRNWFRKKKTEAVPSPKKPRPALSRRPIPDVPLPLLQPKDDIFTNINPSDKKYGSFHRLPLEIRKQILAEAFGHRAIHIDLSFNHPLVRQSAASASSSTLSEESRHCALGRELIRDESQPKGWQWFGCACHRRTEWTSAERKKNWKILGDSIGLHDDECLKGLLCKCVSGVKEGTERDSCAVGIMGWLLSCHSAFVEGLDALFSTSTLHISSLDLLLHLPKLIYPHLLQQVTSLELLLGDHDRFLDQHPLTQELWKLPAPDNEEDKLLHKLCRTIPEACPNTQTLHIAVQYWVAPFRRHHPENDRVAYFERNVLGPIESVLRVLGHNCKLKVSVPGGIWLILFNDSHKSQGDELICEMDTPVTGRFQKLLPSFGSERGEQTYWICSGWNDKFEFMPAHYTEYDGLWGRQPVAP